MKNRDLFSLKNRVAIVTGGGSGIGKQVAMAFSDHGAKLVIADINEEGATQVVSEIKSKGREAISIRVDVTRSKDVQSMVGIALKSYGRIDILFNNAGINIRGPAESFPPKDWNRVIATNLTGMFLCAQAVGNVMIKQRGGKIIITASVSSKLGHPGALAYSAAKHGLVGMAKVMAVEWAKYGVNVNCIGPGIIRTPMTTKNFTDTAKHQELVNKVPMGRLGESGDLIGAVLFLASKASDYITGQTIYIDGGRMID